MHWYVCRSKSKFYQTLNLIALAVKIELLQWDKWDLLADKASDQCWMYSITEARQADSYCLTPQMLGDMADKEIY